MRGRHQIVGALIGGGILVASALVRTFNDALADDDQWSAVLRHEQRFIQAMRVGTAAEGDDAGGG